jgi:hypothetical protein
MPDAGQVFYIPPETRERPGKGHRPHLVVSLCTAESDTATFAYGSTRSTDAAHGAAHVLVDPFATGYRGTGLSQPTYFYPSRLVSFGLEDLPEPSGRIIDELPAVRQQLRRALGLARASRRSAASAARTGVGASSNTRSGPLKSWEPPMVSSSRTLPTHVHPFSRPRSRS